MYYNNRSNGFGLTYGNSLEGGATNFVPWFDSYKAYIRTMEDESAVLLSGEPGAGKSHITEDVVMASRAMGRDCLQVWCHINGSSKKGRTKTEELLAELLQARSEGVLVLDNVDYAVYTGGNRKYKRSNSTALAYRDFLKEVIAQTVDSEVSVFATGHTKDWRYNHSRIPDVEAEFMHMLPADICHITFSGAMTEDNVRRILEQRDYPPEEAANIASALHSLGQLSFRNAFHIRPLDTSEASIVSALQAVEDVKNQKMHGGR